MNRTYLFVSACAGMFLFGIALVLLGTLFGLPEMRERLELTTLVRQGDLQTLLYFALLVTTIATGPLIDRFGHKLVLALSAAFVAVSLAGFAYALGYRAAQALSLVLGFGAGGLNMATNVLVSDIYDQERGGKLNRLGSFFGVGALCIPFATAWFARAIDALVLIAALLAAVCAVGYAVLKFPEAREASGAPMLESFQAIRYPGLLLFGTLLFFESGNESAVVGWITTWATHMGASVRSASLILALFQVAMMSGRLLAEPILKVVAKTRLVSATVIAAAVSVTLLLLARSVTMLAIATALIGLTFASVYPTVLALAGDRYQRYAATVFGVLFAIGLAGGMAFPWAMGHVSQSQGMRAGMLFPLGGILAITVIFLAIRTTYLETAEGG